MIYTIIPVHNRIHCTGLCLDALYKQLHMDIRIIVVDDGSTDGTNETIRRYYSEVSLIKGSGSLWWTGAINLGLRTVLPLASSEDYVLLLNNDIIIPSNYIKQMHRACRDKTNSIIGSVEVLEGSPETIHSGGVRIHRLGARYEILHRGEKLSLFGKGHFEQVSFLPGRGTLYPVSVFRDVQTFDDKHFKQCGDTELPRRALQKGYQLLVCYDAVVITINEGSSNINSVGAYGLSDFSEFFWGVRSNFNLKYRWYFGDRYQPRRLSALYIFAAICCE